MSDRLGQARRLGHAVEAKWRREDTELQLTRLHRRRRAQMRRRIALVPLTAAAIAGVIAIVTTWSEPVRVAMPSLPGPAVQPAPTLPTPPAKPAIAAPHVELPAHPEHHADPPHVVQQLPAPSNVLVEKPPTSTWRDAVARADYATAWAELAPASELESMPDLLLAGDVARLSGHPRAAVAPLERAIALHADDPRAPLAAFTLGRIHLEDLGAPRDAALAFARSRELAPDGPLAEDALAREVEAWSRAGEVETARDRARRYLERYPAGRRVTAVRRFGGLGGS